MSYEIECGACGDTGLNTKGGLCHPCKANGRQPVRDAVLAAVEHIFAECYKRDQLPDPHVVAYAVHKAFDPRVSYTAGWRNKDGELDYIPNLYIDNRDMELAELLRINPEEQVCKFRPSHKGFFTQQAFIVKITRSTDPAEEPLVEPVARWHDGTWQRKK